MSYTTPHVHSSALITIDLQTDFTSRGSLAKIPGTCETVPNVARLLSWYREKSLPIIHMVRLYSPDGSNADICRRELIESGSLIVAPGSDGAELVGDLKPSAEHTFDARVLMDGKPQYWSENEIVIYKPRWGAFYKTCLESILGGLGVDTVVFCGCNFPNCPRTSIYEASERDFRIVLIEDAISQLYDRGRQEVESIGVEVINTNEFLNFNQNV